MAGYNLSGLRKFVRGFEKEKFFLGLDVHKRSYHLALRREDGAAITWVSPPEPEALSELLEKLELRVGLIAYEAGPTGFSLARHLQEAGYPVLVAAPSRIPRPVTAGAKTDRLDCVKLAEYAARGMLRGIAVPSQAEECRRSLERRRHQVVDGIRRVRNRIKGLLLYLGVSEPAGLRLWSRKAMEQLHELEMDKGVRWTLDSLMLELDGLKGNLDVVNRQLAELAKDDEHRQVIRCLQSVPGVGPVVAATFCFELFRPERFQRAEEVAGYLGLAPLVRQSGEGRGRGRIGKVGQGRLKSLLVEAAWTWRAKDPWARQFYGKLLARTGIAQKAIVALARKLAIILWRLCIEKRSYYAQAAAA